VFLIEAFVMGLVVPAAPYGPASYYNYDRVAHNAFSGEAAGSTLPYGLSSWLDYQRVLEVTGLPIQFWRMLSGLAVTFFVVRGLDVFETIQKREVRTLQKERDHAQQAALDAQIAARQAAESWTEALVNISSRIAELEDVDRILLYIVESTRALFNADFMGLALVDGDTSLLELKYFAMAERVELVEIPTVIENPILLKVLAAKAAYNSKPSEPPLRLQGACIYNAQEPGSLTAVPLQMDSLPFGVMWAARFEHRTFSETDMIWLECLADQVVIAVKHGLMTSQIQSLSVIEERTRIGREMHDGLAQVLGYMNLQVQTLEAYLQQGKLDKLHVKLDQMRNAVNQAHADVREKILSLRTTLSNEKGLIPAVAEYLEEFGIQAQIVTHFHNGTEGDLKLASLAEVQLVCILQEALTNVRKHSQAENVSVAISRQEQGEDEFIQLVVVDDGEGFEEVAEKRSFGLSIMRERAQSFGGTLMVWSSTGEGTRVVCKIPCLRREGLKTSTIVEIDRS